MTLPFPTASQIVSAYALAGAMGKARSNTTYELGDVDFVLNHDVAIRMFEVVD